MPIANVVDKTNGSFIEPRKKPRGHPMLNVGWPAAFAVAKKRCVSMNALIR